MEQIKFPRYLVTMKFPRFKIEWIDAERKPQCPPNPKYPTGKDVDLSGGAMPQCCAALPYPAKRCGLYLVECPVCGLRVAVTTAGRPDDPRLVKMACKAVSLSPAEEAAIDEGLAQADRGEFATDEEMDELFNRLRK